MVCVTNLIGAGVTRAGEEYPAKQQFAVRDATMVNVRNQITVRVTMDGKAIPVNKVFVRSVCMVRAINQTTVCVIRDIEGKLVI